MTDSNAEPGLPHPLITWMQAGITPRRFAGIVGGIVFLVGIFALFAPVSGDYDAGMFGNQSVDCGTAIASDTGNYGGNALDACRDALSSRRAWGWPVTGLGAVALLGATVVRNPSRAS